MTKLITLALTACILTTGFQPSAHGMNGGDDHKRKVSKQNDQTNLGKAVLSLLGTPLLHAALPLIGLWGALVLYDTLMDKYYRTPEKTFRNAVFNKDVPTVRQLRATGAIDNINHENLLIMGRNPLHHAAGCRNNTEMIRLLLEYGANIGSNPSRNELRTTAFHAAARSGDCNGMRILLSQEPARFYISEKDFMGNTPLHYAVERPINYQDDIEMAKLLIEAGASLDETNALGKTPLHYAVSMGHMTHVRRLLNAGADVNAIDNDLNTPIGLAIIRLDTDRQPNISIDNIQGIISILEPFSNGAYLSDDSDDEVDEKVSAQHAATSPSADSTQNEPNKTPIQRAADSLELEAMYSLLHASQQEINWKKKSLLYVAIVVNSPRLAQHALEQGCKIDEDLGKNKNLLHLAVEQDNVDQEIIGLLVDGMNSNQINARHQAYSPIEFCLKKGKLEMFEMLLHHGAYDQKMFNMNWTSLCPIASSNSTKNPQYIVTQYKEELCAIREKINKAIPEYEKNKKTYQDITRNCLRLHQAQPRAGINEKYQKMVQHQLARYLETNNLILLQALHADLVRWQDIQFETKCPVCYECYTPSSSTQHYPVMLCGNGHLVCKGCLPGLTKDPRCPQCRQAITIPNDF